MSTATSASAFDRMEHSVRALDIDFNSQESVYLQLLFSGFFFPYFVFFHLPYFSI